MNTIVKDTVAFAPSSVPFGRESYSDQLACNHFTDDVSRSSVPFGRESCSDQEAAVILNFLGMSSVPFGRESYSDQSWHIVSCRTDEESSVPFGRESYSDCMRMVRRYAGKLSVISAFRQRVLFGREA